VKENRDISNRLSHRCKPGDDQGPKESAQHAPRASHPRLRTLSSRDVAEVLGLMTTSPAMSVVEVAAGIALDRKSFRKIMGMKVPVVFRGYASDWKCIQNWTKPEYLLAAADEEAENLPHRKYRKFTGRSEERGRLHLTDGRSKAKSTNLKQFLAESSKDTSSDGSYLLGIHSVGGNSNFSYCPVQRHADDGGECPPLCRDVPNDIGILSWYSELLAEEQGQDSPIPFDHQQFFLTKGYAFTDLHYDSYDNFYVSVLGTRRWTLACPAASRWLIPSSSGKLKSGSNVIPHLRDFPDGSPAQIYPFAYVDLSPSDVLYVPNCWWHLVESIPADCGYSCAFNFFYSKPADVVFKTFQENLTKTESLVNSMRSICRNNLASFRDSEAICSGSSIKLAPGKIEQELWDQVIDLIPIHQVGELVTQLYEMHARNSTYLWRNEEKATDKSKGETGSRLPSLDRSRRSKSSAASRSTEKRCFS
jgi:hypothetical protein